VANCFFDTSALGKNYHVEVGTEEVERLLALPQARHFISRSSIVEVQSVFAGKVRTRVIADAATWARTVPSQGPLSGFPS
jgi:hypothetical protein